LRTLRKDLIGILGGSRSWAPEVDPQVSILWALGAPLVMTTETFIQESQVNRYLSFWRMITIPCVAALWVMTGRTGVSVPGTLNFMKSAEFNLPNIAKRWRGHTWLPMSRHFDVRKSVAENGPRFCLNVFYAVVRAHVFSDSALANREGSVAHRSAFPPLSSAPPDVNKLTETVKDDAIFYFLFRFQQKCSCSVQVQQRSWHEIHNPSFSDFADVERFSLCQRTATKSFDKLKSN